MNNLEKMRKVGEILYGEKWQSPLSRTLELSDKQIRNYVSGKSPVPADMSVRLISVVKKELSKARAALDIINEDKIHGDDCTTEIIQEIVDRYSYQDGLSREHAIDAVNNAVTEETFLSDLDSIAKIYSRY